MKVFLSSVIRGMQETREAAARALTALGHDVKRAEDYEAMPDSP